MKRSTFALEKHQGARRRIIGKVNPGARPWNLKNLYDEPNKRKERVTGCPGICAGHFPSRRVDQRGTLYVEKLRFRRCFLCSRYHASVEYLGKMSPQGALFFPRVRSVVWQRTSETVKGFVLHRHVGGVRVSPIVFHMEITYLHLSSFIFEKSQVKFKL